MIPEYLIIHTAAYKGDADIKEITRWHVNLPHNFRTVCYHYYIRSDGTIEIGRKENEKGAHCKDMGMNSQSLCICFEGHGDYQPWTKQQEESYLSLCNRLLNKYDIPVKNIWGHRETGAPKTCPGTLIDMHEVRLKMEVYKLGTL